MYYAVRKTERVDKAGPNDYYLLWDVWMSKADYDAGKPAFYPEDGYVTRAAIGRRVVTNRDGWLKRVDGTFIDPTTVMPESRIEFEYETVNVDLRAEFRDVIERTIRSRASAGKIGSTDRRLRGDGVALTTLTPSSREVSP